MSWVKRGDYLDSPASFETVGGAQRPPLFLNSGDKSPSPRAASPDARWRAPTEAVVRTFTKIGNRLHEQSDRLRAADPKAASLVLSEANLWRGRGAKIEACGQLRAIPHSCKNGHVWNVAPLGCGIRMCPRCEHKAARHVEERLAFLLSQFEAPVRLLTLTIQNRPQGSLAAMLEELAAAFGRLRKSKLWRKRVRGAVVVFECTASEDRGWHAHVHVAWDGKFLPWKEVLAAWQQATRGAGQRIDVRAKPFPKLAAVRYLSKYASKGVRLSDLPEAMASEFVQSWWRFRTLRTYGVFFKLKFEREFWDGVRRCPQCGEVGIPMLVPGIPACSAPPCGPPARAAS